MPLKITNLVEARHRVDDQRSVHGLGQVLLKSGSEEHGHQREHGRNERRGLGAGAGALVHGRLREAPAGGKRAEEA